MLPVVGEASAELWEAAREGQPVVLTRHGRPALVVLDRESYAEVETFIEDLGRDAEALLSPGSPAICSAERSDDDVP